MFCTNCGTNNEPGMNFCKNCGNPLNNQNMNLNTNNMNNGMNNTNMNNANMNSYNGMNPNMNNANMNPYNGMNPNMNNFNNANQEKTQKKNKNGVISIVIGVVSILLSFTLSIFIIPIAIIGIVIGVKAKKSGIVGIVLNVISILITLAILIIGALFLSKFNYIGTYECGAYNSLNSTQLVDYDIEFQLNANKTFTMKHDANGIINGEYEVEKVRNENGYIIYDLILNTNDRNIDGNSLSQNYKTKYSLGIATNGDVELLNTVSYSRYACRKK